MSLIPLFLVLNALYPVFYSFLFVSLITPGAVNSFSVTSATVFFINMIAVHR